MSRLVNRVSFICSKCKASGNLPMSELVALQPEGFKDLRLVVCEDCSDAKAS